jgi:rhamnose transport system substrate-binding protein
MKKVLPQYPSVNLVTVAYGDDLSDKATAKRWAC